MIYPGLCLSGPNRVRARPQGANREREGKRLRRARAGLFARALIAPMAGFRVVTLRS
jgi:hypothetical protein